MYIYVGFCMQVHMQTAAYGYLEYADLSMSMCVLWQSNMDPENNPFLVVSLNLPTPITARV